MIKDAGSKYDDYSILPKIRQILLHWGYELPENIFFINSTNKCIKMSYYQVKKSAEYYLQNRQAIKEKPKNRQKNLSEKEKDKVREYQRKRYQQLIQYKKEALQNNWVCFCSV